ncbi:MAG TPA: carboxypeptidase regulatory-like domain-containing protein [Candidatus Latescibacteria bacterium]|nr:carboxypeptidase regulatory-like domain-containing protein [Candidatus Latescibacterota bacterium]
MRQRFKWHIVLMALLVTLGTLPTTSWAALTGKIAGRVSDQSGNPLPGVAVFIQGRQLGATTDSDGRYFILQVPPGTYTVEASLVGYQSVRLQNVTVNMDRTTEANFSLRESTIEVDAVTVVAQRPIVQQDVTSTQLSVTTEQAQQLPVNTLLDAIGFQAGIDIQNKTTISVRGSSPDQINFQVDGFQQTNPIENRSYTTMNQALIQEVQVLTGAFTAEYFSRAAVVNVVTRDPGEKPSFSGDFRYVPARQQHFGVGAYDANQFDRLLYRSPAGTDAGGRLFAKDANGNWTKIIDSDKPIWLPRTDLADISASADAASSVQIFQGWDALLTSLNSAVPAAQANDRTLTVTKGKWTKAALIEYWDWQHRGVDYTNQGDYYIDAALTAPLVVLPRTGVVVGFKDLRSQLGVPAIQQAYTDRRIDLGFKSSLLPTIKLELRGSYQVTKSTMYGNSAVGGNVGTHDAQLFFSAEGSSNSGGSLFGNLVNRLQDVSESGAFNKYNLASCVPHKETTWGLGARVTHTLSRSTYYSLSYEYFTGKVDAKHVAHRDTTRNIALVNKDSAGNTIYVNEGPMGFWPSEGTTGYGYTDIPGVYLLTGGGYASDFSKYNYSRLRFDAFSQVNRNNGIKLGAEAILNNLTKDYRRVTRDLGRLGHWVQYETSPWQLGAYVQDKMEYEGLIANVGMRIDGFNSGADILWPDLLAPAVFQRAQLIPWLEAQGMTVLPDDWLRNVRMANVPMAQDSGWMYAQIADSYFPKKAATTKWKLSPRLGISHPVGTSTKFFFNFGWMYSTPKAGWLYGYSPESFQNGSRGSEIRGMSNPNLDMARSVVYEVGFEQSIRNTYVARVKGYSKDDDNMPVAFQGVGWDTLAKTGNTFDLVHNGAFSTSRGMEISLDKVAGRFFGASLQLDYRVYSSGNEGFQTIYDTTSFGSVNGNKGKINVPYRVTSGQSEVQPSLNANIVLRTPSDWGMMRGDWSLSLNQTWSRGGTMNYDPFNTGNPTKLRFVDVYRTNVRLNKGLSMGSRNVSFYVDVRNVFNQKTLNIAALRNQSDYIALLATMNPSTGKFDQKYKVGDSRLEDVVERRFARDNDWLLYLYPREFQVGMRVNL